MQRRFVWDLVKAENNRHKHGVSFETALLVFSDPLVRIEHDCVEGGEYRWQAIGTVDVVMLVVAHTFWEADDIEVVRIISARRATRAERRDYEQTR